MLAIDKIPIDFNTINNPLNFKQEPNQAKYYVIWKSINDTITKLSEHTDIINEKYNMKECMPMVKKLIESSSELIKKSTIKIKQQGDDPCQEVPTIF